MTDTTYDDATDRPGVPESARSHDPDRLHPLVDVRWLATHLHRDDLTILDASMPPHDNGGVRIPGARRFDLEGAFSDPSSPLPHTQPTPEAFEAEARRLGVFERGMVVVYDVADLYSAARAWWLFLAMGHERVAVLDGGLAAWQAEGLETEPIDPAEATGDAGAASDAGAPGGGTFVARPIPGMLVDADEVARALAAGPEGPAVVDARSHGRFVGTDPEPRPGLRGGHMPGAANLPYLDVQVGGRLRPDGELRELVDAALGGRREAIFSCGSGVTACVTALAARAAGYGELAVYDGSWTEWGDPASGRSVVTGEA